MADDASFFHVLCGVFAWNKFCWKGQFTWILCHFSLFSRFYIHFFSIRAPAFTRRSIFNKDYVLPHFHPSPKSISSIAMIFQILKFEKIYLLLIYSFSALLCNLFVETVYNRFCVGTSRHKYPLVKFHHDHSPNIRMVFFPRSFGTIGISIIRQEKLCKNQNFEILGERYFRKSALSRQSEPSSMKYRIEIITLQV